FVSVTDQAGFPIKDLASEDFTLQENGVPVANPAANPIGENDTIALSMLMDFSGSIIDAAGAVENMEEAAKILVGAMRATDEADIIKYADVFKAMTPDGFTSDKTVLEAAIEEDPGLGRGTALYDTTVAAIARAESSDTAPETARTVVINLTDGEDRNSQTDLDATINDALDTDIPVFTVGFGEVDPDVLQQLADATGGLFYSPAADANLQGVSDQLVSLLFNDQYVITFDSALGDAESASLEVAVGGLLDGEGSKTILACQ
ncbi:MAG: VWA domain-containing protein, partial [Pirellulaceae bacterium]